MPLLTSAVIADLALPNWQPGVSDDVFQKACQCHCCEHKLCSYLQSFLHCCVGTNPVGTFISLSGFTYPGTSIRLDAGPRKLYSGLPTCAGVPLLFMTNLGADPSQELQEVANSIVGAAAYHQLAMGQGQTQPALDLLQSCARSGTPPHTCLLASGQFGIIHVLKHSVRIVQVV